MKRISPADSRSVVLESVFLHTAASAALPPPCLKRCATQGAAQGDYRASTAESVNS